MSKWLVPEVVQTSSMDCGPAALKAVLDGHRVRVDYAVLREACETSADGTSIDAIERLASSYDLECEQLLVPIDHLLARDAEALPAIVVTKLPSGVPHFVVVWRVAGPFVQVMDPHVGRRWMRASTLLRRVFEVVHEVAADDWREYAGTRAFTGPLLERCIRLGIGRKRARALVARATDGEALRPLASLDAALRFIEHVAPALSSTGRRPRDLVEALFDRVKGLDEHAAHRLVPARFWSAGHALSPSAARAPEAASTFSVRGGIALHVAPPKRLPARSSSARASTRNDAQKSSARLFRRIQREPALWLSIALTVSLAGVIVAQALAFRIVVEASQRLTVGYQRLGAMGWLLVVYALGMALGYALSLINGRLGRKLELGLRRDFFLKLRRLPESYFRSRSTSDMVERAHALQSVRGFPGAVSGVARAAASLAATATAIVWLAPDLAVHVGIALAFGILLPIAAKPLVLERELAVRAHSVGLVRLYLDAILGNTMVRAHGAERNVERTHEEVLDQWMSTTRRYLRLSVLLEAVSSASGLAVAAVSLDQHFHRGGVAAANGVLLALWLGQLPSLSSTILHAMLQLPSAENAANRIFDVLDAREGEGIDAPAANRSTERAAGVSIELRGVSVEASGQLVLDAVDLRIEGGSHVAVVGRSGSGKSSLVALLLGLLEPSRGALVLDGQESDPARVDALRRQTAWAAPETRVWNETVLSNVVYGTTGSAPRAGDAVRAFEMESAVSHLPMGLQSRIGEAGVGLSGGEAQRIRLARTHMRADARLVLLDEAFRGLPREQRRRYLADARRHWPNATLVVVTHDVDHTTELDRVIVLDHGRVVEDGPPRDLLGRHDSRYARLVGDARDARETLLASAAWSMVSVRDGRVEAGG